MEMIMPNTLGALFNVSQTAYNAILIALFVLMVVFAIFTIVVILFQPGNSSGVEAISGSSETFFGKNKSKSVEGKLKKWTYIALVVLLVCSVLFFLVSSETLIGVGAVVVG